MSHLKILPLEMSFATHEKAKYWSPKNTDTPKDVHLGSNKRRIFDCHNCKHTFESQISNITHGRWCPYCCYPSKLLCADESCNHCFTRSFASHEKSQFWSEENILKPREVLKGTIEKYKFICIKCKHMLIKPICYVVKGEWCQYCSNNKLCDNISCAYCFSNSFASHEKARYWSNYNNISPRFVFKGSNKQKYKFDCEKCMHTFEMTPNSITSHKSWCNYCDHLKLCIQKECKTCYNNTVQSTNFVKYWSNKNNKHPRMVFKNDNKKYIFDCQHCNKEYIASPNAITRGTWCTCKTKKTETKLYTWLKMEYRQVKKGYYSEWCINPESNYKLPYDFLLNNNIIIELDGMQHFKNAGTWTDHLITKERDIFKMNCAIKNGCHVLRIFQTDVWEDKVDWKELLTSAISAVSISNKPIVKYINNEEFYKNWFGM